MKKLFTATCSLILVLLSCGQSRNFTKLYDLDFRLNSNSESYAWMPDPKRYRAAVEKDNAILKNGKHPVKYTQQSIGNFKFTMALAVQQRIVLPQASAQTAAISFTCRSQNVKSARLITATMDAQEAFLRSDTLLVQSTANWETYSKAISIVRASLLTLRIEAEGLGCDSACEQNFWVDRVTIYLDGKNIDDYPLPVNRCSLSVQDATPLSFSEKRLYDNIPELKSKRITAAGETVHGCQTITEVAVQLMKHQVANDSCKLILLELPMEEVLSYNRFVQGDSSFSGDSLMQDFPQLFSRDVIVNDLLVWLRDYNRSTEKKVWLMGMDIDFIAMNSAMWMFDYCYTLNKNRALPALDSLCNRLFDYTSILPMLDILERNATALEAVFGGKELAIVKHYVSLSAKAGTSSYHRFLLRDSMMYANARFLTELLCPKNERTFIYAHAGHVGYLNNITTSFGAYMKRHFGDDYSCIAVAVGGGTTVTTKDQVSVPLSLASPPRGSMEYVLGNSVNLPYFYLPVSMLPLAFFSARNLGNNYVENQFSDIMVPKNRMDGIIFIRHGEAAEDSRKKFGLMVDRNVLIMKKFVKNRLRLKENEKVNKKNLDDLAATMSVIGEDKQRRYVGGVGSSSYYGADYYGADYDSAGSYVDTDYYGNTGYYVDTGYYGGAGYYGATGYGGSRYYGGYSGTTYTQEEHNALVASGVWSGGGKWYGLYI
jgi:erythromycin esterase-like protein